MYKPGTSGENSSVAGWNLRRHYSLWTPLANRPCATDVGLSTLSTRKQRIRTAILTNAQTLRCGHKETWYGFFVSGGW